MNRNLIFLAPLSAMRKRTRLAKMARVLEDRGIGVRFLGWEREKGELARLAWGSAMVDERAILRGGGYASRGRSPNVSALDGCRLRSVPNNAEGNLGLVPRMGDRVPGASGSGCSGPGNRVR
jgi:hypothetical protein